MKVSLIEGQISLFDIPVGTKPKEEFKITDEEVEEALLRGPKKNIYNHFINEPYNNALFVKHVYGTSGIYGDVIKGFKHSGADANGDGLRINKKYGDKFAEVILNWNQVSNKIQKLINENRYLTHDEKVKYGFIKENPVKAKANTYNTIIDKYKDTCRFIVKGKYGLMVHLKNKAMFYDEYGKLKSELNSSFTPLKPLGSILVDNIGYGNKVKTIVLDNKSTKMDKKITKNEVLFTKGENIKVVIDGNERTGEIWRLQDNGSISVLFKDTNSIGAYPKKFIMKL